MKFITINGIDYNTIYFSSVQKVDTETTYDIKYVGMSGTCIIESFDDASDRDEKYNEVIGAEPNKDEVENELDNDENNNEVVGGDE